MWSISADRTGVVATGRPIFGGLIVEFSKAIEFGYQLENSNSIYIKYY